MWLKIWNLNLSKRRKLIEYHYYYNYVGDRTVFRMGWGSKLQVLTKSSAINNTIFGFDWATTLCPKQHVHKKAILKLISVIFIFLYFSLPISCVFLAQQLAFGRNHGWHRASYIMLHTYFDYKYTRLDTTLTDRKPPKKNLLF